RQDDGRRVGARHNDRLLGERLYDLSGQALAHTRCELDEPVGQLFLAQGRKFRGRGIALEEVQDGGMIETRTEDAFQRRMDLRQQAPRPIAYLRDLLSQIV